MTVPVAVLVPVLGLRDSSAGERRMRHDVPVRHDSVNEYGCRISGMGGSPRVGASHDDRP